MAAATAAQTAAAASGRSGTEQISAIALAVADVSASQNAETDQQLQQARETAAKYAAAAGVSTEQAKGIASDALHQNVPFDVQQHSSAEEVSKSNAESAEAAVSATVASGPGPESSAAAAAFASSGKSADDQDPMKKPGTAENQGGKPTPESKALNAAHAALSTAKANGQDESQQFESSMNAAFLAAAGAGVSADQAHQIAKAAAEAVTGGLVEGRSSVTLSPSVEIRGPKMKQPHRPESPAEIDAAVAGSEAARGAAAEGKSPKKQADAAAIAAGRAAINGKMTQVGAEEAARKAAVEAAMNAGLDADEAARVGTIAAEEAAASGAFTAHDIVVAQPLTLEAGAIKAKEAAADEHDLTVVDVPPRATRSGSDSEVSVMRWALLAAGLLLLLACCTGYIMMSRTRSKGKNQAQQSKPSRGVAVEPPMQDLDLEKVEQEPLIQGQSLVEASPSPPRAARPSSGGVKVTTWVYPPVTHAPQMMSVPTAPAQALQAQPAVSYIPYAAAPLSSRAPFVIPQAAPAAAPVVTQAAPVVTQAASAMSLFDALDANGDGVLDAAELSQLKITGVGRPVPAVTTATASSVMLTEPVATPVATATSAVGLH